MVVVVVVVVVAAVVAAAGSSSSRTRSATLWPQDGLAPLRPLSRREDEVTVAHRPSRRPRRPRPLLRPNLESPVAAAAKEAKQPW